MTKLQKYKDDFFLFLEAGFIAINQGDEDSALKLFKTCSLLDPKNSMIQIGFGYLHFHKLEFKSAIKLFETVLQKEPKNEIAKTLLGISLGMCSGASSEKGEKILSEMAKSSDKEIKKLSSTSLDFIDNFIKKEPTPMDLKKNETKKKKAKE